MHRRILKRFGFTLIEMVVAISVLAVLGVMVATFISRPLEGYRDLARRAALVDVAETALRRLERDIRNALPNSVRVTALGGGGFAVEILPIIDGGQYRAAGTAVQRLTFAGDGDFDVNGLLRRITVPSSSSTHRIVINNLGPTGAVPTKNDAYQATGTNAVITAPGTSITYSDAGGRHHINLNPTYDFSSVSTYQRFYIITTPITYLCTPNATDPALGTLMRYEGYAINGSSNQPTDSSAAPLATATSTQIAGHVSACAFSTGTSDIANRMLVTFTLSVEDEGEKVGLIHQVQIDNSQ